MNFYKERTVARLDRRNKQSLKEDFFGILSDSNAVRGASQPASLLVIFLLLASLLPLSCGENKKKKVGGLNILHKFLNSNTGSFISPSGISYEFKPDGSVILLTQRNHMVSLRSKEFSPDEEDDTIEVSLPDLTSGQRGDSWFFDKKEIPTPYVAYLDKLRSKGEKSAELNIRILCHYREELRLASFLVLPKFEPKMKLADNLLSLNAAARKIKYIANTVSSEAIHFTDYSLLSTYQKQLPSEPSKWPTLPALSRFEMGTGEHLVSAWIGKACSQLVADSPSSYNSYQGESLLFQEVTPDGFKLFPREFNYAYRVDDLAFKYQVGRRNFKKVVTDGKDKKNKLTPPGFKALAFEGAALDSFFEPSYLGFDPFQTSSDNQPSTKYPSLSIKKDPRQTMTYDKATGLLTIRQGRTPLAESIKRDGREIYDSCKSKTEIKLTKLEKLWSSFGPSSYDISVKFESINTIFDTADDCVASHRLDRLVKAAPKDNLFIFVHFPYRYGDWLSFIEEVDFAFVHYDPKLKSVLSEVSVHKLLPHPLTSEDLKK